MKIQPIASVYKYCPQCGAQNPAPGCIPFKCSECGFASFFGPVAAVGGLVVDENGRLLLVRRAREPGKGKWGLPGGFVDAGETAEEALQREILEETDLTVSEIEFLFSSPNDYNYRGVVAPVIDFFFLCPMRRPTKVTIALDELEHFVWTKPNQEHLENMAFPSNRLAIEYWLSSTVG